MKQTLDVIVLQVGPVETNCYIVANQDTKEALCFDPGADGDRIAAELQKHGLTLQGIVLTHCHFDHIMGIPKLQKQVGPVPIYASSRERRGLMDKDINLTLTCTGQALELEAQHYMEDGDCLSLLGQEMRCLHTPGHTAGGMCYYFPMAEILISGDTLFRGSVGRTDLPTGNGKDLLISIKTQLLPLPEKTVVYPGHGPSTTIKEEKNDNQYLR